jgi:nucleotide-binding universal stress UspA family protein
MKVIVVPTDFSTAAENASRYAAQVARDTGSRLLLMHVYQMPVGMVDMPVMMISGEEIKKNTDELLSDAREMIVKNYPGLEVEVESRLGDLVEELNGICSERQPLAVVVGSKQYKGIEKFLFGNTTQSIIRHCNTPVISVPAGAMPRKPSNVVLATDLANPESIPAARIVELVQLLKARLHLAHISEDGKEATGVETALLDLLREANPAYHLITDDDVIHGLLRYVEENNVDLLLALPHKHNIYERLFFKLHTDGLLEKMPVPVMCIQN